MSKIVNKQNRSFLETLKFIDQSIFLFIVVSLFMLFFVFEINLNFKPNTPIQIQKRYLNPDAKLYFNIADNIAAGKGYIETQRNKIILPSAGHPIMIYLLCIKAGLSPYDFSYLLFFLSAVLLLIGIKIYTNSNCLTFLTFLLYTAFFANFRWLSGNIEPSIVFSNSLLIVVLALMFRSNFNSYTCIIAGITFAYTIFIRPLMLFPLHGLFAVFTILVICILFKKRWKEYNFIRGVFIFALTAEIIILATLGYSYIKYKDSRLITGTYGAYAVYPANNINVPINKPYDTRADYPVEFKKMFTLIPDVKDMTWQKRHDILMDDIIEYIKENPKRAIKGYWWRLRHFLGFGAEHKRPGKLYDIHQISSSLIIILLSFYIYLAVKNRKIRNRFLGLMLSLYLLIYFAIHSLAAYAEFRYVMATVTILVSAIFILIFDVIKQFILLKEKRAVG